MAAHGKGGGTSAPNPGGPTPPPAVAVAVPALLPAGVPLSVFEALFGAAGLIAVAKQGSHSGPGAGAIKEALDACDREGGDMNRFLPLVRAKAGAAAAVTVGGLCRDLLRRIAPHARSPHPAGSRCQFPGCDTLRRLGRVSPPLLAQLAEAATELKGADAARIVAAVLQYDVASPGLLNASWALHAAWCSAQPGREASPEAGGCPFPGECAVWRAVIAHVKGCTHTLPGLQASNVPPVTALSSLPPCPTGGAECTHARVLFFHMRREHGRAAGEWGLTGQGGGRTCPTCVDLSLAKMNLPWVMPALSTPPMPPVPGEGGEGGSGAGGGAASAPSPATLAARLALPIAVSSALGVYHPDATSAALQAGVQPGTSDAASAAATSAGAAKGVAPSTRSGWDDFNQVAHAALARSGMRRVLMAPPTHSYVSLLAFLGGDAGYLHPTLTHLVASAAGEGAAPSTSGRDGLLAASRAPASVDRVLAEIKRAEAAIEARVATAADALRFGNTSSAVAKQLAAEAALYEAATAWLAVTKHAGKGGVAGRGSLGGEGGRRGGGARGAAAVAASAAGTEVSGAAAQTPASETDAALHAAWAAVLKLRESAGRAFHWYAHSPSARTWLDGGVAGPSGAGVAYRMRMVTARPGVRVKLFLEDSAVATSGAGGSSAAGAAGFGTAAAAAVAAAGAAGGAGGATAGKESFDPVTGSEYTAPTPPPQPTAGAPTVPVAVAVPVAVTNAGNWLAKVGARPPVARDALAPLVAASPEADPTPVAALRPASQAMLLPIFDATAPAAVPGGCIPAVSELVPGPPQKAGAAPESAALAALSSSLRLKKSSSPVAYMRDLVTTLGMQVMAGVVAVARARRAKLLQALLDLRRAVVAAGGAAGAEGGALASSGVTGADGAAAASSGVEHPLSTPAASVSVAVPLLPAATREPPMPEEVRESTEPAIHTLWQAVRAKWLRFYVDETQRIRGAVSQLLLAQTAAVKAAGEATASAAAAGPAGAAAAQTAAAAAAAAGAAVASGRAIPLGNAVALSVAAMPDAQEARGIPAVTLSPAELYKRLVTDACHRACRAYYQPALEAYVAVYKANTGYLDLQRRLADPAASTPSRFLGVMAAPQPPSGGALETSTLVAFPAPVAAPVEPQATAAEGAAATTTTVGFGVGMAALPPSVRAALACSCVFPGVGVSGPASGAPALPPLADVEAAIEALSASAASGGDGAGALPSVVVTVEDVIAYLQAQLRGVTPGADVGPSSDFGDAADDADTAAAVASARAARATEAAATAGEAADPDGDEAIAGSAVASSHAVASSSSLARPAPLAALLPGAFARMGAAVLGTSLYAAPAGEDSGAGGAADAGDGDDGGAPPSSAASAANSDADDGGDGEGGGTDGGEDGGGTGGARAGTKRSRRASRGGKAAAAAAAPAAKRRRAASSAAAPAARGTRGASTAVAFTPGAGVAGAREEDGSIIGALPGGGLPVDSPGSGAWGAPSSAAKQLASLRAAAPVFPGHPRVTAWLRAGLAAADGYAVVEAERLLALTARRDAAAVAAARAASGAAGGAAAGAARPPPTGAAIGSRPVHK